MINILHTYIDLKPGGACKVMINMANIMSNYGHNVSIISNKGDFQTHIDKKINFTSLNLRHENNFIIKLFFYINALITYFKFIKNNNINIIINHHRYLSLIFFLISFFLDFKIIYVAHATSTPMPFFKSKLLGDKIWAVSKTVKNHFIKYFKINPNDIDIIPNCIDELKLISRSEINRIKKQENIQKKSVITCVAHYRELKRQDFLIDAFKLVLKSNSNSILILYGFGTTEAFLKQKVFQANLCNKVLFIHNKYTVEEMINISDIIVLPSIREGLPLSLIEGISLGKPIIGTAKTGMQDVITHGYNGFLFSPKSISSLAGFINLILSNEKLYTEMSINAKKSFTTNFNIKDYKFKLLNSLSQLIN